MITKKQLAKFAEIAVRIGANLQPGQELVLSAPVECAEFARLIVKEAYKAGGKRVTVKWGDDIIARTIMEEESIESLTEHPQWTIDRAHYEVDTRVAFLFVAASDPMLYEGIDDDKLTQFMRSRMKTFKFSSEARAGNHCRWTIVSVPTKKWAQRMFPKDSASVAVSKLWDGIIKAMRLDTPDPVKAWQDHIAILEHRADFLNKNEFEYIEMKSKNGTDIKVGLAVDHFWMAAGEIAKDGLPFTANMPTEEIFSCPHRDKVDGIVHSAMPLCHMGNIIDEFWMKFEKGAVVDYGAKKGYDVLKNALETDEGSLHIGEIALIGKNSPIATQHLLYYNTLFDENASCHLALGAAYPTNIKGDLTPERKKEVGFNESLNHIDFMIGTEDMDIWGIKKDGTKVRLFKNGDWVI